MRGGGDGSAFTETVSATLRVTDTDEPFDSSTTSSSPDSASLPVEARVHARLLQVVEQVLGLVLEAQDLDVGAHLDVGERHARHAVAG